MEFVYINVLSSSIEMHHLVKESGIFGTLPCLSFLGAESNDKLYYLVN